MLHHILCISIIHFHSHSLCSSHFPHSCPWVADFLFSFIVSIVLSSLLILSFFTLLSLSFFILSPTLHLLLLRFPLLLFILPIPLLSYLIPIWTANIDHKSSHALPPISYIAQHTLQPSFVTDPYSPSIPHSFPLDRTDNIQLFNLQTIYNLLFYSSLLRSYTSFPLLHYTTI